MLESMDATVWFGGAQASWVFFGTSIIPLPEPAVHGPLPRVKWNASPTRPPFNWVFSALGRQSTSHLQFPDAVTGILPLLPFPNATFVSRTSALQESSPACSWSNNTLGTEHHVVSFESTPDPPPVREELDGTEEQPHACRRLAGSSGGHNPSGFAATPARLQPPLLPAVIVAPEAR